MIGGERKEYQVLVDPARLRSYNVSLHEIEEAITNANTNSTGGFLVKGREEVLIRNLGTVTTLEDLRAVVRGADGDEVRRGQTDGREPAPPAGPGRPGAVWWTPHEARRCGGERATRGHLEHSETTPCRYGLPDQSDRAGNREPQAAPAVASPCTPRSFARVRSSIGPSRMWKTPCVMGALLVVIVLLLFLFNVRTTFITLTAIPLSLIVTVIVFRAFGLSINTMTRGLAIAIGELVDDAIVDVENVFRRLRENRQPPEPRPVMRVIFEASSEVRNSIVFATIIVILVFLPLSP